MTDSEALIAILSILVRIMFLVEVIARCVGWGIGLGLAYLTVRALLVKNPIT